ncbi:putative metal-dependent HD superfamily phosphohydrolase [Lewinella marina]|uniref:N-methyl-D-aspartate receptor NMDAR2C subunit n=1 Tax=Neolewinella marina TaxID=438751 RepID=A0A2G0CE96_9BACT|nr:hypothetical protein [Neolewinella marina]NJB87404.1 putative metal-dependent HD superfamily phosphohydrolase [Neolewinella marina]PHK98285.1 hypothetical protein CGL56_11320 [Neolewinella marina]
MIQQYFEGLARRLPSEGFNWDNIRRAYTGRPYHNLEHLDEMVAELPRHRPPKDPEMLGVALLYHDIVYKPTRIDNEERSAQSAVRMLEQLPSLAPARIERCHALIMATKDHLPSEEDDGDEALLIDLDLVVLARDPAGYAQYTAGLRQEFWMLPYFTFRPKRTAAITAFLDRPHIFHTEYGREHYEPQARENLWRELRNL